MDRSGRLWFSYFVVALLFGFLFFTPSAQGQGVAGNSGALTTSIPIDVPAGRHGLTPQLALIYNSSVGNGFLGVGWSLSGFSIIERASPGRGAPKYDGSDIYLLDGQELIPCGGSTIPSCTSGGTHFTKSASFTKIKYDSSTTAWTVWQKNGTKSLYGIINNTYKGAYRWGVDQAFDSNGNLITYSWSSNEIGCCWTHPNTIVYGATTIKFYWEARGDNESHADGTGLETIYGRIKTIDITANGTPVRAYKLEYQDPAGSAMRSRLVTVRQFGNNRTLSTGTIPGVGTVTGGSELPASTFGWQGGMDDFYIGTTDVNGNAIGLDSDWSGDLTNALLGDFNGDGRTDILRQEKGIWASGDVYNNIHVYLSNGDGTFSRGAEDSQGNARDLGYGWNGDLTNVLLGDFNGDGRIDILRQERGEWASDQPPINNIVVYFSNGDGSFSRPAGDVNGNATGLGYGWNADLTNVLLGDFNGDGLTDILRQERGEWASDVPPINNIFVYFSNGDGTFRRGADDGQGNAVGLGYGWNGDLTNILLGDFDGDGRTDILRQERGEWASDAPPINNIFVYFSNGDGSFRRGADDGQGNAVGLGYGWNADLTNVLLGDFNGDGRIDIFRQEKGAWASDQPPWNNAVIYLSNGDGSFSRPTGDINGNTLGLNSDWNGDYANALLGDFNGDGLTDILRQEKGLWASNDVYNNIHIYLSKGDGTFQIESTDVEGNGKGLYSDWSGDYANALLGDFNGDGLMDIVRQEKGVWASDQPPYNNMHVYFRRSPIPDLLTSISNGIGGRTTIAYLASSAFWVSPGTGWNLPFITKNVSSTTLCDKHDNISCVGNALTTGYSYKGGYHNTAAREFRGFSSVKATNMVNGNTVETFYHQGNGIAAAPDNGNDSPGYTAGAPFRVEMKDATGVLYSKKEMTYWADADGIAPYFAPLQMEDSFTCDPSGTCKQARLVYTYDHSYGNLFKEEHHGDLSTSLDDRLVLRSFAQNTTAWIVGLPITEIIYQEILTPIQRSGTSFFYDEVTDCNSAATNQLPTKGNLTRVVRWHNGATHADPEIRMAYDAYGNLNCTRDANGNTATITYDGSFTFPKVASNALGHQTTTQYYGVDGVASDTGLYGQVKSVSDVNAQQTTIMYDYFGRKSQVNFPNGSSTSYLYNSFGTVGLQSIQTNSPASLSSWVFFDGLNRTIIERKTGPDGKIIRVDTVYNSLGQVTSSTLPYFEGGATNGSTSFIYDVIGRQKQITNQDTSRTLFCYSLWSVATINANNQMRRETKDALGHLVQVDEYTSSQSTCPTTYPPSYATTYYQYNILGSLTNVTDHAGNVTTMGYDSLSRKISMTDPDMGTWSYKYDPAGNLMEQKDAKNQTIFFQYDSISRLRQKDYGTQKALGSGNVKYSYDITPPGFTSYPLGRLSQVIDSSGTAQFGYDNMGRITRTDKIVDSITYTAQTGFDLAGRVKWVSYPDGDVVKYDYNNPLLSAVYKDVNGDSIYTPGTDSVYMQYSGFNALGQASTAIAGNGTNGNGVKTIYTHAPSNFRLSQICTVGPGSAACGQTGAVVLQNLTYVYDNGVLGVGNITNITDARATGGLHTNQTQTFGYDALNRLTSAVAPNSYGNITYTYNQIGNMTCNSKLSNQTTCPADNYTYGDAAHRHAVTIAAGTNYVYDANGNMTARGTDALTYDYENRLVTVTNAGGLTGMIYDGDGGRVKKIKGTVTTIYIGKLFECVAPCKPNGVWTGTKHIFAGSTRIASKPITTTGDIYYYHGDHLGSTSVLTDKNGVAITEYVYLPFGDTYATSGPDIHYKYTGQEKDTETSLYFYNSRYYDAKIGRFTQADIIVPSVRDPQALNRYSYVVNNPLVFTDPTGNSWVSKRLHHIADQVREGASDVVHFVNSLPVPLSVSVNLFVQGIDPIFGTALMTQTETGRYILGGEIIVATAACWYCSPQFEGALIGEIRVGFAGYKGAGDDGDPSRGFLIGVIVGGITGAIDGPGIKGPATKVGLEAIKAYAGGSGSSRMIWRAFYQSAVDSVLDKYLFEANWKNIYKDRDLKLAAEDFTLAYTYGRAKEYLCEYSNTSYCKNN